MTDPAPTSELLSLKTTAPESPTPLSPRLSVVMPAFNAAATIAEQLDALASQTATGDWEVIVVDNGSTDATVEIVERARPRIRGLRIVDASAGRGPAYARNVGARVASGNSLAFCDADDVVGAEWVEAVERGLVDAPFVCGPVELRRLNPAWIASSRGTTGTRDAASFDGRFPFASSCNLGIDRELFDAHGGFDETLTVGEDVELSMRLHLAGVELHFVPTAIVHYRYRATVKATFDRALAYGAARPVIAERWRTAGGRPEVSRTRPVRNWWWLFRHVFTLRSQAGRARWLWVAGQRIGSMRGSLRVRRLYF